MKIISKLICAFKTEKALAINIMLAFLIKGLSLLVSTFSLPLYIRYFNDNRILGIWYTILSVLSWINMCDLGLGNGLRNRLTECISTKKEYLAKKYVSSTYLLLSIIIIPVIIIVCILVLCVDINAVLGIPSEIVSSYTIRKVILTLVFGVGINFVLKIINSIIYALQLSSVNNAISLVASLLPLIFILIYKGNNIEKNLLILSWVHIISINLPLLVATFVIFCTKIGKAFAPHVHEIDMNVARSTLGFGAKFFFAQVFFMFLMSTNEIFISNLYSSEFVVEYQVYYKLFMLVGSIFMLALTPIWSKVTKDLAERKYVQIKKINKILYRLSVITIITEFILIFVLQNIIDLWLQGNAILVDYRIAVIFAFFGGLYIFNIVLTTIANGIGELKTQIVFYGLGSILKIPFALVMKNNGYGWESIVFFNSIVLLLFCVYQYLWIENKINMLIKIK